MLLRGCIVSLVIFNAVKITIISDIIGLPKIGHMRDSNIVDHLISSCSIDALYNVWKAFGSLKLLVIVFKPRCSIFTN